MKRASELEQYNPASSEQALGGDEEGWVATHTSQQGAHAAGAAASAAPGQGASPTAARPSKAGDDDDIPDISELELAAADDEVRGAAAVGHDSSMLCTMRDVRSEQGNLGHVCGRWCPSW
jgi:hypothetical protein